MEVSGGLTDLAKVKKLFVSPVTMFEEPASIEANQKVLTEAITLMCAAIYNPDIINL